MKCVNCNHDFKAISFAYKGKQRCSNCGTINQIVFPSGMGFIPIIIAFFPAIYVVMDLHYQLLVGLSIFILLYWPIDIIMNIFLIYYNHYQLYKVDND